MKKYFITSIFGILLLAGCASKGLQRNLKIEGKIEAKGEENKKQNNDENKDLAITPDRTFYSPNDKTKVTVFNNSGKPVFYEKPCQGDFCLESFSDLKG